MVNHQDRPGVTFKALDDPTRRAIPARPDRRHGAPISEQAEFFTIELPGVTKHLGVPADVGLVTRWKTGRAVTVRLRPQPLCEARDWLRRRERFRADRPDQLAAFAEHKEAGTRRPGR